MECAGGRRRLAMKSPGSSGCCHISGAHSPVVGSVIRVGLLKAVRASATPAIATANAADRTSTVAWRFDQNSAILTASNDSSRHLHEQRTRAVAVTEDASG
jgi:hypothetical protein